MGTISEKLTYLNETKSKIKDNINLTGAGLTNQTPFRQYATDLKTALLNILNNGIDSLYNNFPKTTGTGTNIVLNNTLQAPIRSVINGDTEQKSYSGKNLLKNHATSTTASGITFTVNDDGSIVANGTSTGSGSFIVPQNYNQSPLMPAGTYTVSFTNKMPSSASAVRVEASTTTSSSGRFLARDIKNDDTSYTFTTSQDFYLAISYIIRETTVDNFYNMIQVETGSSATEIEPYVGGQPSPSPDYPQEIKSVTGLQKVAISGGTGTTPQEYEINLGKNLVDTLATNTAITGSGLTYNRATDGSIQITGTSTRAWDYTLTTSYTFKAGETYTFSYDNLGTTNVNIYIPFNSANGGQLTLKPTDKTITRTITQDQTLAFTWSLGSGQTVDLNFKIMIVKGSEATSYSPYFTPIHLYEGDQIIGTPNNWSIKRQIGSDVLNGTEDYTSMGWTGGKYGYRTSINNLKTTSSTSDASYVISNYYKAYSQNDLYNLSVSNYGIGNRANQSEVIIRNDNITTINDLKTWLSTHNTKVVYELATPTTEPITNTELIEDLNNFYNAKSYNGQTNISVEGDLPMILDVSAIIDE